jgi:nucleoside-diphosphate-sugar epimerase
MICVTGGSGFFGIALVKRLLALGKEVRVLDCDPIDISLRARVDFRQVDIRKREETISALSGCNIVYHNAAVVPISRAGKDFWEINEKGTDHVLAGAKRAGAEKIIFYSTSSPLYGLHPKLPVTETSPQNPVGDYGKSKQAAEEVCKRYRRDGLDISIVRPRTIIGPGRLGIFAILFEWIRTNKHVWLIGNGRNRMQFVGLHDLLDVSLLLLERGHREDFNIGAEKFATMREDLNSLIQHAGSSSKIIGMPAFVARNALWLLDKFRASPFVDFHYKTIDKDFYFDISKAKKVLGWQPKESNSASLIQAYDWYVSNIEAIRSNKGSAHRTGAKKGLLSILR